tara:strand:+ start:2374 stop:2661 length:288 start_codon:yes stop_codon:yes gene_type:complete
MSNVVNKRHHEFNNDTDVYIGRPSIYGNPFNVSLYGRKGAIEKYEIYARKRLLSSDIFREKVKALQGKTLVCFCKPQACHGDVLVELANKLNKGD